MKQVDFYITNDNQANAQALLACRVAEKAYKLGHRVHINVANMENAQRLDDLLWVFRQGSFVPHARIGEAAAGHSPVSIGADEPVNTDPDVLINLADDIPAWADKCERIAEIVDGDAHRRQQSRVKYKHYRDKGCQLQSHELNG